MLVFNICQVVLVCQQDILKVYIKAIYIVLVTYENRHLKEMSITCYAPVSSVNWIIRNELSNVLNEWNPEGKKNRLHEWMGGIQVRKYRVIWRQRNEWEWWYFGDCAIRKKNLLVLSMEFKHKPTNAHMMKYWKIKYKCKQKTLL